MSSQSLSRLALIVSLAVSSLSLHASCARSGSSEPEADNLGVFGTDAGGAVQNACIATECPAPYATCPGEPGFCATNLTKDVDHCGSCDRKCPTKAINASYVCSDSQCKMVCDPLFADCNNSIADGCETPLEGDPLNCGACGTACKNGGDGGDGGDGVLCWRGACGCPNGYTQCGLECKKLSSDDLNCGACDNACKAPTNDADPAWRCGANVTPANTKWTCLSSACELSCKPGFGDCNNVFCTDGCEIDLKVDPENCGACGNKCAAGQTCEGGSCMCPAGTINCGGDCVDVLTDARNCGKCGRRCPGPSSKTANGSPVCEAGQCSYTCFPGFANCDDNPANGCEANLLTNPNHCGTCPTKCNVAAGQPCIVGKCLTRECDAGVVN